MSPLRIVSFLIIILAGLETSPQCAAGIFLTCRTFPSGANPSAAVVQDFNNDGISDIASANYSNVSVLLNNGDGTFGDGSIDLTVSNVGDGTVGIYLGQGDGTFAPPLIIRTRNPIYSAAADFNQDGKVDFVVGGDGLKLFLGNGDGTFQDPQTIYSDYGPVKVADLDRDGRLDVTISGLNNNDGILVLRGKGDGTFSSGAQFPTGSLINGYFALSDLNGDGKPEAIVGTGQLIVLLNITHR